MLKTVETDLKNPATIRKLKKPSANSYSYRFTANYFTNKWEIRDCLEGQIFSTGGVRKKIYKPNLFHNYLYGSINLLIVDAGTNFLLSLSMLYDLFLYHKVPGCPSKYINRPDGAKTEFVLVFPYCDKEKVSTSKEKYTKIVVKHLYLIHSSTMCELLRCLYPSTYQDSDIEREIMQELVNDEAKLTQLQQYGSTISASQKIRITKQMLESVAGIVKIDI